MHPEPPTPAPADGPLRRHARAARADAHGADAGTQALAPKRKRRVWPWWVAGAVVLLLLAAAGVVAAVFWGEVKEARSALESAKAEIATLSGQLSERNEAQIQASADQITADVAHAAHIVEGPLWHLAANVPFVGQNVDAVQRITRAVDILVDRALPPGMQFMSTVDLGALAVEGGGIDLEPFRQVEGSIPQIADAFARAQSLVAPIDRTKLLPEVAEPIDEIASIIEQAAPALELADHYLPTLLNMAGSGGTKTYLLIFQNNAEIRATGGNPASSMIVTMSDGKLGYADQATSTTFYEAGTVGHEHTALPPEVTGLYLPGFTRYSQDYTFTPDFPTTAQLFQDLWRDTTGASFDGVISLDPVVLSHMLAVSGPVTLGTGEQVTSENAVRLLLSEAYERYPGAGESDLFFSDVAKRVFDHLTSASWDPMAMLGALEQSAAEQRINLAFVDPEAQAFATELGVDGALATDTVEQTQVGIYLNNSSVSKLDFHLTSAISATCDVTARTMTTTMTLHNSITDDIRSNYTLGHRNRNYGIPRTSLMLDVLFFAPPGATITQTVPATGDVGRWERSGIEKGNTALSKTVFVPKDQTVTVSYTVAFPEGDLGPLNLRHTPTANPTQVTVDAGCAALFPEPTPSP